MTKRYLTQEALFTNFWITNIAGAVSGVCALSVFVPMELLKVKAQNNRHAAKMSYSDAMSVIYQKRGLAGFYKGASVTFWREVPTHSLFFTAYE